MSIKRVWEPCGESLGDGVYLAFHDKVAQTDGLVCGFDVEGDSATLTLESAKRIRDALDECIALYEPEPGVAPALGA